MEALGPADAPVFPYKVVSGHYEASSPWRRLPGAHARPPRLHTYRRSTTYVPWRLHTPREGAPQMCNSALQGLPRVRKGPAWQRAPTAIRGLRVVFACVPHARLLGPNTAVATGLCTAVLARLRTSACPQLCAYAWPQLLSFHIYGPTRACRCIPTQLHTLAG